MGRFDKKKLVGLRESLRKSDNTIDNEEDTKHQLIVPFIEAMGYSFEYGKNTARSEKQADTKNNGKKRTADYVLCNKRRHDKIYVECKVFGERLDKHIDQLFGYYASAEGEIKVGILTNGDDYWFFGDSENKENVMNKEPYLKLKLSEATDEEIESLRYYSLDNIDKADPCKQRKAQKEKEEKSKEQERIKKLEREKLDKFSKACEQLYGTLQKKDKSDLDWLVEGIIEHAGLDIEPELYNRDEYKSTLCRAFKEKNTPLDEDDMDENMKKLFKEMMEDNGEEVKLDDDIFYASIPDPDMDNNESNTDSVENGTNDKDNTDDNDKDNTDDKQVSNIKLNHEYVYNDYSDGNWLHHKIDYATILGTRYNDISGRTLLVQTLTDLLKKRYVKRESILSEPQFSIKSTYKITEKNGYRGAVYIKDYDLYISTSYDLCGIINFISKLLMYAGLEDNNIKISFKA